VTEPWRAILGAASSRSEYTQAHTLTFTSGRLSVMITLSPIDRSQVRIDGWATGYQAPARVELQTPTRTLLADVDDNGRFAIDPAPRGLAQFVFLPAEAEDLVITPTVEI
jgi:hypothetical protein